MPISAKQGYLAAYSACMGIGWLAVFIIAVNSCVTSGYELVYARAGQLTKILQLVSLLETVHAAAGLVRSDVASNMMQWAARSHALFLAVDPEPSVQSTAGAAAMLMSWSLGETTRYPWCDLTLTVAMAVTPVAL
jgi:hypothetical protein